MDRRLIPALRRHGIDVATVQEDDRRGLPDLAQLEWATVQQRVVFTQNASDFQRLHTRILSNGQHHGGIIVLTRQRVPVGGQLHWPLAIAAARTAEEMADKLEFLTNWR